MSDKLCGYTPSKMSTTTFLIKKSKHHYCLPHLSGTNNATNRVIDQEREAVYQRCRDCRQKFSVMLV
jgi:hypothetical protein